MSSNIPDQTPVPSREKSDPATWVDAYGDYLYRYAYSRLRNQTAAEDLVQETFLAALRAHGSFAGQGSEKTWLVGILKHKLVDLLRKTSRETPLDSVAELSSGTDEQFIGDGDEAGHWKPGFGPSEWGDRPDSAVEKKEFWMVLKKCTDNLPDRMAMIYTLYEIDELPGEAICKELGITSTNLWVILHRARLQLRRCLELNWFGQTKKAAGSME